MALHEAESIVGGALDAGLGALDGWTSDKLTLLLGLLPLMHDTLHYEGTRVAAIAASFYLEWLGDGGLSMFRSHHQVISLRLLTLPVLQIVRIISIYLRLFPRLLSFLSLTLAVSLLRVFDVFRVLFVVEVIEAFNRTEDVSLDSS